MCTDNEGLTNLFLIPVSWQGCQLIIIVINICLNLYYIWNFPAKRFAVVNLGIYLCTCFKWHVPSGFRW